MGLSWKLLSMPCHLKQIFQPSETKLRFNFQQRCESTFFVHNCGTCPTLVSMVHRGLRLRLRESHDLFFGLICSFKPVVLEYLLKVCGTDRVLEIGEVTIRQAFAVQRPLHPLQEGWGLPQTWEFYDSSWHTLIQYLHVFWGLLGWRGRYLET